MSAHIEPTDKPSKRTAWLASTATSVVTAGIAFGMWGSPTRYDEYALPDSRLLLGAAMLAYLSLLFVAARGTFTMWIAIPLGIVFGFLCVVAIPATLTLIGWQ